MKINKYPDGTSYVEASYSIKHPHITFRLNSYNDLWHLNQYVDALKAQNIRPSITIPNLIDAQADRRFAGDQSSGLKLVCEFLNRMEADFRIYHPHNPEVVEALMDNVEIIDNSEFISEALLDISQHSPGKGDAILTKISSKKPGGIYLKQKVTENLVLMSSDAGGFKPLMRLCDDIKWKGQTTSASKFRNEGKPLVQIVDRDDYEGKDILIVDDICVYGGTFKGLAKLLRERNCGKIYLAVSHLTIQNHKEDDTVFKYFDQVFTTNSKFDNYWMENKKGEQVTPKNLTIVKQF